MSKRKLPDTRKERSKTEELRELGALLDLAAAKPAAPAPEAPVPATPIVGSSKVGLRWNSDRPHILVIACSDGRLQEPTDVFLERELDIRHYDRLYVPGGAGALSPSGRDFHRAHQVQQECRYLVELHDVERVIALFHGPAPGGPSAAMCADYRRKFGHATDAELRAQQERDAKGLLAYRWEWALRAKLLIYRCEVDANGDLRFVTLHADT